MGEAPGRTGEPNSSAPDTAYAVQAAIFRLAPVPHARPTLLIPPGDLLVVHGPSLPPPALCECCHRGLARRLVAVRRAARLALAKGERPQPWLAYLRGGGLHDAADRDAVGEYVEVVVVPFAGRAKSRDTLEDQLLGHVSRKLTRSPRQRGRAWEPATTAAAAKAAANNS